MILRKILASALIVLPLLACTKEPVSATDPLPLPDGMEANKDRLDADGYTGETYKEQLRKFYESYARLRINGVVINTDLWYELYGVDRNCNLYLPHERRTYIW